MVLAMLMAIQSAQLGDVCIPAGAVTLSGTIDSSFSFGMDGAQTKWDAVVNPHDVVLSFKPSPALPELNFATAHPFLPRMELALHPLVSPILCPDEMFKQFPPLLMLMSDGELFYKDFSESILNELTVVYFTWKAVMNGAKLQAFLHEKLPHVFPIYDFPEVKTITESWNEIRVFILDIAEGNEITVKMERVHWDGSKDDIAEQDYVKITPHEAISLTDKI
jgi:acetyl esterase/lipase